MPERYVHGEWSKSPERRQRRVVITAMGMTTPLGNDVETNWRRLQNDETGITPLNADYKTEIKVVGRVNIEPENVGELLPPNFLTQELKRDIRKKNSPIDRSVLIELPALAEALTSAGFLTEDGKLKTDEIDPARTGIIFGTAVGGFPSVLKDRDLLLSRNGDTSSGSIPRLDGNRITSVPGWLLKLHGPSFTVLAACASSTIAAQNAYEQIYLKKADVMITGGSDAFVNVREMIKDFEALSALSKEEDPQNALRAYDKYPTGTVAGEGSGVLVFESEEHAVKRGANILAVVGGYGLVNDGYHETQIDPDAYAFREAMIMTLMQMGTPEGMHVNLGHGGGTPDDLKEELGLVEARTILGRTEPFGLSSTKAQTAHTWGSDGAIRLIFSILAQNNDFVIPTKNSRNPISEYVVQQKRYQKAYYTLTNTGLGGITGGFGILPYSPL